MKTYIFINNIFRRGNQANYYKIRRKINTRTEDEDDEKAPLRRLRSKMIQECEKAQIGTNPVLFNFIKPTGVSTPRTGSNLNAFGVTQGILDANNVNKEMLSNDGIMIAE